MRSLIVIAISFFFYSCGPSDQEKRETPFSLLSVGNWDLVASAQDTVYFVDYDRILTTSGKIYAWTMQSYLEQLDSGAGSAEAYYEVDCDLFRARPLHYNIYAQALAAGNPFNSFSTDNPEWEYPRPKSVAETQLKSVCDHVSSD